MTSRQQPPSVIHLLWGGEIGGIERVVGDLAREQARRGIDVAVAFAQATGPFAGSIRNAGLETIDLGMASGYDLRPSRLRAGANSLRHGDVVHMHAFNVPLWLTVMRTRRPVVFTDHGKLPSPGHNAASELVKERLLGRWLRRDDVAVAVNSRHTARQLCTSTRLSLEDIEVVHNGVDLPSIRSAGSSERPPGPLVAASIGRLVPPKRVERFLHAMEMVNRRTPALDVRGLIVGDGPEGPELRRLAAGLGLTAHVEFMGARSDVGEILDGVDVLVHASRDEPFGMVVAEAGAHGALPIVFDDAGGALEVIPPDGLVVSDVAEIASALSKLPGSQALSPAARNARQTWTREHFSIERTADKYDLMYATAKARGPA